MADNLLEVRDLSKHFGGIRAVEGVSFDVGKGSILSLIGPNGAGKSTFINVVSGIYAPDGGEVRFNGEDIGYLPAHAIAAKGIGRTFQLEELFGSLTVLQNVMVGCHTRSRNSTFSSIRLAVSNPGTHFLSIGQYRGSPLVVSIRHVCDSTSSLNPESIIALR